MPPRYQRSAQVRLRGSIPNRKVQSECAPVTRETELKHLADRCSQAALADQFPCVQVILISPNAVGLIEASEREVRPQGVVGEPNAGFIIGEGIVCRGNF